MYLSRSTQLDHPFNWSSPVATEPLSKLCHNLIHALMCPELTEVGHASQKEGCEGGDQRIDILKLLNLMRRSRWKRLFSLVAWEPISKLAQSDFPTLARFLDCNQYVLCQSYQMIQASPPQSTFFNVLTKSSQAAAENFPFCTIDPNEVIILARILLLVKIFGQFLREIFQGKGGRS